MQATRVVFHLATQIAIHQSLRLFQRFVEDELDLFELRIIFHTLVQLFSDAHLEIALRE